jgi:hypothetical protein
MVSAADEKPRQACRLEMLRSSFGVVPEKSILQKKIGFNMSNDYSNNKGADVLKSLRHLLQVNVCITRNE